MLAIVHPHTGLARQNIVKAQNIQKQQYDRRVKESKINIGELVMLKVDSKFKLDRQFRGPYRVHNVIATCAYIQPINMPNSVWDLYNDG